MKLEELVRDVRSYRGVVRKSPITDVASRLIPIQNEDVLAAYGEDAAVIKCGRELLLMAADGILQDLVNRNPFWAGYCAVLVNVNDIAAMGGKSIAMVNVLSCSDDEVRAKIVEGMRAACDKFEVPMVGGHLHPDTTYTAVDVAILGKTDRSRLVLSSGAGESDPVIFAMDLDGQFTEGVPYSWDTTSKKSKEAVRRQLRTMNKIAPYLTAGKDISNPGALGTLGMLLEASGKGGIVDISKIPKPKGVDLFQWLTAYQGCGFVVTCREARTKIVIDEFSRSDITAEVCGTVSKGSVFEVELDGQRQVLFDFDKDTLGCAAPQKL
ncbi:MAG: methanogenesis marker 2 protein [Candidatus Thermoplasmatota archaeon]|nr:methanogenesis marker 2 protein [Candidatus Thermoplasmatota archaeon]